MTPARAPAPPAASASALPAFHHAPAPGIPGCFIAHPAGGQSPVLALHGPDGDAAAIAASFAAHPAFAATPIIAPVLGETGEDPVPALIALLDHLAATLTLPTARIGLFGFSSGALIAQRLALHHPARTERLCLVSAEWFIMPDPALVWPYGIGNGEGGALVGPEFLAIPTAVIVGNRDTRIDPMVRQDPEILAHQGRNRLRRARCYVRALKAHAASLDRPVHAECLALHGISPDFARSVTEGDLVALAAQNLISTIFR
jgi:pimeloyl-ACP methyl ester carboxylesterase